MLLLAVGMLISPVMGKGPINAVEKNPRLFEETGIYEGVIYGVPFAVPWTKVDLVLPSGVTYRRIYWPAGTTCVLVKPADSFYCPTEIAFDDTDFMDWLTPDYIGTWVHMSKAGYEALFAVFGMTVPSISEDGVYLLTIAI
jgi:hypothetical protein